MSKRVLIERFRNLSLPAVPTKKGFRIATFNVHFWSDLDENPNVENIIKTIKELNADVLCLQEVLFDPSFYSKYTFQEIKQKLGYKYHVSIAPTNWKKSRYGNAILSNFPLKHKVGEILPGKGVKRGLISCLVEVDEDVTIPVLCTHLDAYDHTGETRRIQLEYILSRYAPSGHAPSGYIICGDFNATCTGTNEAYSDGTTLAAITKTHKRHLNKGEERITCWAGTEIDFIFLPKKLEIEQTGVSPSVSSDHLPVIIDL